MKNIISRYTVLAIAMLSMLVMGACSDDDDFAPGEDIPAGSTGAFFSKSNETDFNLDVDPSTITLKVGRTDSTAEATVPIIVQHNDTSAISVPQSVHFDAGEGTTDLVISTEGLTENRTYDLTLAIDSTQTNVYANGGAPTITLKVMYGDPWKVIISNVTFYMNQSTSSFPQFTSDVYQYKNENRFYIKNFMGSGRDLEFSFDGNGYNADDPLSSSGYISWTDPGYSDTANSWDYITDVNGNYNWSVAGSSVGINTLGFYIGNNYLDFTEKYFQMWAYIVDDDADNTSSSDYMYGTWQ